MFPILKSHQRAFTIMEIMIVCVILATIAAFAIPNYSKSVEQTHSSDAFMQLKAINTANRILFAKTNSYWPTTNGNDITAINTNLGLSIIPNGMTYSCDGNGITYTCTAVRLSPSYSIEVTQADLSSTNPKCSASSTCP